MRLYRRSKEWDLVDTLNRCYFDADHGRVRLALERLRDLEAELGEDAKISYAEGLLRKDFLGQGVKAYECFVRALGLDPNHASAACNAAVYAPNEAEYRKWGQIATRLSPQDAASLQAKAEALDQGIPYGMLFLEAGRGEKPGNSAACIELGLLTTQLRPDEEVEVRRARAQTLRMLDSEAAHRWETMVEAFPPDERLALAEAIAEIDRAITLDEYDAELWNLKSAWCCLMERYEESLACADRAIELRPEGYCRPHQNKALSLWRLSKREEALACTQEALRQAKSRGQQEEIPQLNRMLKDMTISQREPTLVEVQPMLAQVVRAAMVTADQEIGLMKTTLQEVEAAFLHQRIYAAHLAPNDAMTYVPAMAQALSYLSPETCFLMLHEIAKKDGSVYENCMRATLYIAAHAEAVMQRDALRLLVLAIFVPALMPGNEEDVRELYRQAILEVSAASTGKMAQLDRLMRQQLTGIAPALPGLIADQEPVGDVGKARAERRILSKLKGKPFINDSSSFHSQQVPPPGIFASRAISERELKANRIGCLAMVVIWAIFLLARYFGLLTWDWWVVLLLAFSAGCAVGIWISRTGYSMALGDSNRDSTICTPQTPVVIEQNKMPRIMVKCPETGKAVFIGIRAFNQADFEEMKRLGFSGQPVDCPWCGRKHAWKTQDTFLDSL